MVDGRSPRVIINNKLENTMQMPQSVLSSVSVCLDGLFVTLMPRMIKDTAQKLKNEMALN